MGDSDDKQVGVALGRIRRDRRRAPRYPASEPVDVDLYSATDRMTCTWTGVIVNASETGVAVRVDAERPDWIDVLAAAPVTIRFQKQSITLRGEVMWCAGSAQGKSCGMRVNSSACETEYGQWLETLQTSAEKTLSPKATAPRYDEASLPNGSKPEPEGGEDEHRFGRYKLIKRIARGGMAEVFLASYSPNPDFDKLVALKRILPRLSNDEQFVKMFRREARIASQLAHANVVQVFDFGQVNGLWFLAMEYVDGWNLHQVLTELARRERQIPLNLAVYIAREVVRGLAYAHNACDRRGQPLGVVHRDLNPPNILLSKHGEVKIADFGVANVYPNLNPAADLKGKVSYLAPEVISGEPLDQRTDLWALGIMFHELFTGEKPLNLETGSDLSKMNRIVHDHATSIQLDLPELPIPLIAATDMLLHKDRSKRPDNADEIGVILDTVVHPGDGRLLPAFLSDLMTPGAGA